MSEDEQAARGWEARLHQHGAYALYVHIPFCASKCRYCDFASWAWAADDELPSAYVDALAGQFEELRSAGLLESLQTAYIGGGTPSFVGECLCGLVEQIASLGPCEFSSEANPDSLGPELAQHLAQAGLTRLSLGVQSTSDEELAALGRIHSAAQALRALECAVDAGLSTSADLMCAIPLQTELSWTRSLNEVLATGVSHVSVYPLQIEEGTAFGRRYLDEEPAWNNPDLQALRMEQARVLLEGAGLRRYEVASYARPQQQCRHNGAYWSARPYLGLGTGAASMLSSEGYELLRQLAPQLPPLPEGARRARLSITSKPARIAAHPLVRDLDFSCEFLDEGQMAAEDLMLEARRRAGISKGCLAHAHRVFGDVLDDTIQRACDAGLACMSSSFGPLVPTEKGWLLGNELYGLLWDLAEGTITTVCAEAAS